ncbi:hypothetical protein M5X11_28025 [Paenibacillus alginolyticus]|uniref:hypothetical protein n=1 Tax=Paenibacillus alginolyticus TaxID=59839 RepID=UPI000422BCD6|nr:hypothetical protein [Paenibacillus alginolyticus]MCY9668726.1 hypothetical protein [Paenibacillus alginolyticus]
MKTADVVVYKQLRKVPRLPEYEDKTKPYTKLYRNVPIFIVSPIELNHIIRLDHSKLLETHCHESLLILTDKARVMAVEPEGYDYAKYTWTIDRETALNILSQV